MPNFKMEFTIYTVNTHGFQRANSFNEAVRIARRLQMYGFKVHVDVETWRNRTTPQAIASRKTFLFYPNGQVRLFDSATHYFRNGKIVKVYSFYH